MSRPSDLPFSCGAQQPNRQLKMSDSDSSNLLRIKYLQKKNTELVPGSELMAKIQLQIKQMHDIFLVSAFVYTKASSFILISLLLVCIIEYFPRSTYPWQKQGAINKQIANCLSYGTIARQVVRVIAPCQLQNDLLNFQQ